MSGTISFDEYRAAAARTRNTSQHFPTSLNAALGIAGETGEVIELIKKAFFHGKELNREQLRDELGDVLFYLDWLASLHGISMQDIAAANIEKLRKRYPDGWVTGGGNR